MGKELKAQISTIQGTVMMGMDKIYVKNGEIAVDGNVLGTMPGTFYIRPLDLYKMTKMVSWEIIKAVPGMLKQGKKEFKASEGE